ncbi:MAG TPA: hypothetical protein VGK74_03690 [Symbiobacteriaceae bacterium]|jgi:hypothetical protein
MRGTRLNVTALQSDLWPRLRPGDGFVSSLQISRRQLLGLAGVIAASLLPTWRSLRPALAGGLKLEGDERRVAFLLGGRERWVLIRAVSAAGHT